MGLGAVVDPLHQLGDGLGLGANTSFHQAATGVYFHRSTRRWGTGTASKATSA